MKKLMLIIGIMLSVFLFGSCNNSNNNVKELKDCNIIHDTEFGGIFIKKSIADFNGLGYEFGDSVDIKFSNGYEMLDLPYYSGYYVDAGNKLLVGYPGYDYIRVGINYGDDIWVIAKVNESDTATVKLNQKAKYKDIQISSDIHYEDVRSKYTSDEEFANFRNITVGNIKPNVLYRSASPCDNKHNRASYVDKLMEAAGVKYMLNLADTEEKIEGYISQPDFNSPYFLSLYRNEKKSFLLAFNNNKLQAYSAMGMNMNYRGEEFGSKLAAGFIDMTSCNGPYLVHCQEGKDRTGFVCIVLEALCGGTYKEIVDDYMLTYKNYYGIDVNDNRYEILKKRNVDAMLRFIVGDDESIDLSKTDFTSYTTTYLRNSGMTDNDINNLRNKLCN